MNAAATMELNAPGVLRSVANYKALSTVEPSVVLGGANGLARCVGTVHSERNQGAIGT